MQRWAACTHLAGCYSEGKRQTVWICVCLFICVRARKESWWWSGGGGGDGGGVISLFFILGISALEGLSGAVKSHASRSCDQPSVIASLSAQNESSIWPFLNKKG